MSTIDLPDADRFDTYAALDIETDGLDGTTDRLVAIGVGFQPAAGDREVCVHTLSDARGDEAGLIQTATDWLDRREPDGIVTYNGDGFDLPFLEAKAEALEADVELDLPGRHIDLFAERQALADASGEKWPSLEEALSAYNLRPAVTVWDGDVLTNARFAEALAPRYLDALAAMEFGLVRALDPVIRHYASADIEATMALYEADIGREYSPSLDESLEQ